MEGIGTVEIGGAQRDGGRVLDLEVEMGGAGQDAVVRRRVGDCIAAGGGTTSVRQLGE